MLIEPLPTPYVSYLHPSIGWALFQQAEKDLATINVPTASHGFAALPRPAAPWLQR